MAEENLIELKFRIFDGTDIGPNKYDPSTTVAALKEFILARWPQGKEISPRTVNDVKLINAGKILENNRTIAESRTPVGEIPGGIITMHVVVQPPISDKNNVDTKLNRGRGTFGFKGVCILKVVLDACLSLFVKMDDSARSSQSRIQKKQQAKSLKHNRCGCTIL